MKKPPRLVVLISGNGSNLQSIIDAIESGRLPATIAAVVSNNPDAYGLTRASKHQIPSVTLDHRDFSDREQYDQALQNTLLKFDPDYLLLAGFMRILGANFIRAFENRILNIHPSLLPAYKGLNTFQRALQNGEPEHGVSIHLVTAELDGGPVIAQGRYDIVPGDSVEDLQTRGHQLEHRMYPQLLIWISEGVIDIENGTIMHYQQPLTEPVNIN